MRGQLADAGFRMLDKAEAHSERPAGSRSPGPAVGSRTMRVLQFVADGSPGGGTTHVLQLLRLLSPSWRQGLVTQRSSYLSRTAGDLGVESFEVDPFGPLALLQAPGQVRQVLRAFQPDLIHAHGSRAGFLAALARPHVPFVYTVHGLHILRLPPPARWLGIQAERLTNRRASCTIFVSNSDRGEAVSHHLAAASHPDFVIHNGISTQLLESASQPTPRHIGFVGRLEPPKDPLLFIRAMDELPGFRGTMVGAGSLEGSVREALAQHPRGDIRLLGALSPLATQETMRQFDVLVVPSRWEAFGLVALEALALGVPVVATRVGGLAEVIEDSTSGILVDSRSPEDLARAVRRVSDDPQLRQRIVEAGKKRVRELFSEDQMIRRIQIVYLELTQHAGRHR